MIRMSIALITVLAAGPACAQALADHGATAAVATPGALPAGASAGAAVATAPSASPAPVAASPLATSTPAAPPAAAAGCCRVAAGTAVVLEILDTLNSSRMQRGDRFAIRVAEPLMLRDAVAIPAGTVGIGEIVHAAAARGGGAPGELLIAARSLDLAGTPVPLRGLKLGVTGGDNSGMALGVSFAAGPFALFIRGHEIEIPAGTRVTAKLAQDLTVATPAAAAAASAPAAASASATSASLPVSRSTAAPSQPNDSQLKE